MFLRKYWLPLSVFLVLIVSIGLYRLATQPPPEPVEIYKVVEPIEKPTQQPKAQVPVGDTSQDGHFHADGTWHEAPHEPVEAPIKEPVTTPPEPDPLETVSEEERQRIIAQTLEYLPEKLELEKENRDLEKRIYEHWLKQLKYHEERNAQRERNFYDTSHIKERIAKAKAKLDRRQTTIYHLEKWRDEHAKK